VTPGAGSDWIYEFNEAILRASPVVAGDAVVVGLEDGSVGAVSLGTGRLVFRGAATDAPVGGIALTPDVIVVSRGGAGAPELAALATDPNGTLLDEASPTDPVPTDLALGFVIGLAVAAAIFVPGRAIARRVAIRDPATEDDADVDDGAEP
jgi:hypothetical protein